jgi:hypothetical protein
LADKRLRVPALFGKAPLARVFNAGSVSGEVEKMRSNQSNRAFYKRALLLLWPPFEQQLRWSSITSSYLHLQPLLQSQAHS